MRFEDLRLVEPLLRAVRTARYVDPTPIQAKAIPPILRGRDVLGCAQTGTGKTAAFALPILQRLTDPSVRKTKSSRRVRVLVLCPTRELAQQIHDSFRTYGSNTDVKQTVVFGGVNQNPQARALRAGVDVLIATPGRLLDLMGQGLASIDSTEVLVLDEADRMLDMGFAPDLRRILTHVPRKRQTLLFSATMPPPIRKLAADILDRPVPIEVARVSSPAPLVDHWVYHVEKSNKADLLIRLLTETPTTRTLVFTRTKHGADKVVRQLFKAGVEAAAIHGNKSQAARTRALRDFRSGKNSVLIATDIAARGLDIENISHVINFDLTPEPETYVHRIGRTGRAGETGTAVSFCMPTEYADLRAIERLLRQPLQRAADSPEPSDTPSHSDKKPAPARPAAQPRGSDSQPAEGGGTGPRSSHSRKRRPGARPSPRKRMRRGRPSTVSAGS